jgi:hypothetical protein
MDYSTIKIEQLRTLPWYRLPKGNHLQDDPGNGCHGDAPGYPTYFTRSVYNARGDELRNGPFLVITDPDEQERHYVVDGIDLQTLWIPLPLGHPRVALWEQAQYIHFHRCYEEPQEIEGGKPETLIWPPDAYHLKQQNITAAFTFMYSINIDGFYTDGTIKYKITWNWKGGYDSSYTMKRRATEYLETKDRFATAENHLAVRAIQRFYPDYHPNVNAIVKSPTHGYQPNNRWWEREAVDPTKGEK